jgi:hypothetical protein
MSVSSTRKEEKQMMVTIQPEVAAKATEFKIIDKSSNSMKKLFLH